MTDQKQKPTVHFIGDPYFYFYGGNPKAPVASVDAVDHPTFGEQQVRTSRILKKNKDGSFETLNTIYVPLKDFAA